MFDTEQNRRRPLGVGNRQAAEPDNKALTRRAGCMPAAFDSSERSVKLQEQIKKNFAHDTHSTYTMRI